MLLEKNSKYSLYQKNTRIIYQKRVILCNFWNRRSHRNHCFLFLELFLIIFLARYVRSLVRFFLFVLISEQFNDSSLLHYRVFNMCILLFIGGFVILVDIQTGIITDFSLLDIYTSRQSHS